MSGENWGTQDKNVKTKHRLGGTLPFFNIVFFLKICSFFWRLFCLFWQPISYPESSGSLGSGWSSGENLGKSKKNLLIDCSVTVYIVLPQKLCDNKIPFPQSLS